MKLMWRALMKRRKICVVITARPSYSRIKTALQAIKDHPFLELQLVVTASGLLDRYGKVVDFIERDGFHIDQKVYTVYEGENLTTMAKTAGLGIVELATVFDNLRPDVVVTIADRFETISTAVSASYMNIPLCHVQGGELTGSIDDKVRHAVSKLADLHFVSTKGAAQRLLKMGENSDTVFITGCPSLDLALDVMDNHKLDFDPLQKYKGVGEELDLGNGYLLVMQHPVTTEYEESRRQVTETLYAIKSVGLPTLWFWPNVDAGSDGVSKGIRVFREKEDPKNLYFLKNVASRDFLLLLCNSKGLIGNSSAGIRECAFLGVPVVNIGTRQTGRERGKNVVDVPYDRSAIQEAILRNLQNGGAPKDAIYGDGKAGKRIADLLASQPLTLKKQMTY
jgi:UDP-hydrolysing UDP-N-acetyl-D-glucosamine 2-epimerase